MVVQKNVTSQKWVINQNFKQKLQDHFSALLAEEQKMITMFLEELGLQLEWYKYLTSTGKRTPLKTNFGTFARENLPFQHQLSNLRKKYLHFKNLMLLIIASMIM